MKNIPCPLRPSLTGSLALAAVLGLVTVPTVFAATSPYVTQEINVPLAQATDDSVNGVLPFFWSHDVLEGQIESLTDAVSASSPTASVIVGPENTWVGIAWDFGDPPAGHVWRLDRFDAWIAGGDNLRKGYRADLSVSLSGFIDDFWIIPNSMHWADLKQNDQFNHIRYDFPDKFILGNKPDNDRYPVMGFRFLRLNSRGAQVDGKDWQTRFVEIDIWVTAVPLPEEGPVIHRLTWNPTNQMLGFSWDAILGRYYEVQSNTDPGNPNWTPLETIYCQVPRLSYSNLITEPQGFYRVMKQPW